jgi:hypothetical protein
MFVSFCGSLVTDIHEVHEIRNDPGEATGKDGPRNYTKATSFSVFGMTARWVKILRPLLSARA